MDRKEVNNDITANAERKNKTSNRYVRIRVHLNNADDDAVRLSNIDSTLA